MLLAPPHREKLTGLTPARLAALKTLNTGGSVPGDPFIEGLAAGGWLTTTVTPWYSVHPFRPPTTQPHSTATLLSRFAVLHRDADGFVLEHPLGWCDMRIDDARLLALLDGGAPSPDLPADVAARFVDDLRRGGFLVPASEAEAAGFDAESWSTADLWFHRRSTLGERTITWDHFGPTKWAKGRFDQPPARREPYPGDPVALHTPDLDALRCTDPTLSSVVEERVSARTFDDARPLSVEQLAELLYRTARTRRTESATPGEELLSRPYPSAGGVYELELYPVVRNVAGLPPGMYHYDSFDHVLRPVAGADDPAVARLVKPAAATLAGGIEPQVLLVIAARSGRIMWTYEQIGYATILKDVGALMQTVYLAGTAMGVGVCAQGFGDTAAFVAATGVDERRECSVGSIVIGSAAPA
ncbi:SagB family peptide dehydrogenase [Mycobacterium sp. M1]|uniref:SagB family peptide dehydrogenase n=1 Tax=Mycolicibacter acidiphilus TaxID=2835306 RepID=A0ABS5RJR9_9MYCO|nr:SagB family peptide dehydrogenase [Mycolicibacter acidiphilus]